MICDGNSRTQKETGDCKPRLRGRYSSVRYQQDRLEEFPNRANWFRENWGAANVGGAVHRPISGRSTDSACQETGNRDATSHPQAAPVRQFLRKNSVNGWRFSPAFERAGQPGLPERESARNSTLRSGAYIESTRARWMQLTARGRMITSQSPKRFTNSIGSMISPPLTERFGGAVGVRI